MKIATLLLSGMLGTGYCLGAVAQVGTAVEDTARAGAQKTKEAGRDVAAGVTSGSDHVRNRAAARRHKMKAHHRAHEAKEAAENVGR